MKTARLIDTRSGALIRVLPRSNGRDGVLIVQGNSRIYASSDDLRALQDIIVELLNQPRVVRYLFDADDCPLTELPR